MNSHWGIWIVGANVGACVLNIVLDNYGMAAINGMAAVGLAAVLATTGDS